MKKESCYKESLIIKQRLIKKGLLDSYVHVLSYGGGINSSALFFYILEQKYKLDLVIFADTGEELLQTYQSVEKMKQLCKKNNIKFVTVKSKYGNLYEYYWNKKAVMSLKFRDCTSKFKIAPIRQYLRKNYPKGTKFLMYIGIAADEIHRAKKSNVQYIVNSYPFVDDKINRQGNIDILNKYNFKASKSGCKGCPFQKKEHWINLYKNNIKEFKRWKKLEENNSNYPKILINGSYSLKDLEDSIKTQRKLDSFKDKDLSCREGGCFL